MDELTEKEELNKSFERLKWVFNQLKIESPYGKKALSEIKAYRLGSEKELVRYFEKINVIITKLKETPNLFSDFNRLFMELRNISGSIRNLSNNQILGETELFEIKNFAIIFSEIKDLAEEKEILSDNIRELNLKPIIKLLNPDKIVTRSFYIHESWSKKLQSIREEKKTIESKIIKAQSREEKDSLRNQRADIVNQERDEELIVRRRLSDELKKYEESLRLSVNNIGLFELMLAKAELALTNKCCFPTINNCDSPDSLIIEKEIEPEIAENLRKFNRDFTPISIEIQKGITLLTGANMGGKSVSLKSIALNADLVRFGFYPFAQKFSIKLPDFVEFISGDLQNSNAGLSSFGAEIMALTSLLNKIKERNGLILCDELARSTNPYEGSRFVQALSDRLQASNSYAIIATHYDGIKTQGAVYYQVAGLRNLMKSDLKEKNYSHLDLYEQMDYHLIKLSEASSVPREALTIGTLLGLPKDFIESLKKYYDDSIC